MRNNVTLPNSEIEQRISEYIHSEKYRRIAHMKLIDGLTLECIAEVVEMSPAQTQKILDAIMGNRMADMQSQINALQLQNAMSGVLKFPSAWTYAGGQFPPTATA